MHVYFIDIGAMLHEAKHLPVLLMGSCDSIPDLYNIVLL